MTNAFNIFFHSLIFTATCLVLPAKPIVAQNIPVIDLPTNPINITDGLIDTCWNSVETHHILLDSPETNPEPDDFSGYWKALYDKETHSLYILVDVTDDSVTSEKLISADSSWNTDHITIYFNFYNDGFPNINNGFYIFTLFPENNAYSGRIGLTSFPLGMHNYIDGMDKNKTAKGWFVELFLSLEHLINDKQLFYIDTIGFDVGLGDNDKGYGERKHRLSWNDFSISIWNNPSLMEEIILDSKTQEPFKPTCKADFSYHQISTTASTKVQVNFTDETETNDEIINWSWTFGDDSYVSEKNPVHTYDPFTSNTRSCLYITTRNGCNNSICKNIIPPSGLSLYGNLNISKSLSSDWKVIAFKNENNKYLAVDYALMNSTRFEFNQLIEGNYLFYALPGEADENYFPTYFVNAAHWQQSDIIPVSSNIFDIDIHLNPVPLIYAGTGKISGRIINGQDGIPVVLAGKNQNPLRYVITSNSGYYKFDNLPFGEFILYPEYPGFDNSGQTISLSANFPAITNIDFTSSKSTVNIGQTKINDFKIACYNNEIKIKSNTGLQRKLEIHIYNVLGETLYKNEANFYESLTINTSNFNSMILLIYLSDGDSFFFHKIVK